MFTHKKGPSNFEATMIEKNLKWQEKLKKSLKLCYLFFLNTER